MDPMVSLVAGWLLGSVLRDGEKVMRLVKCDLWGNDGFDLFFASGLRLRVTVTDETPGSKGNKS